MKRKNENTSVAARAISMILNHPLLFLRAED
jgi:hypothetical protein